MKTVKEISALSGVSVRTLHYYDEIGLLPPTRVTAAGYRLYDEKALQRLFTILLFRKLQFPLRQIKAILDAPRFDPAQALEQQIDLLELKRQQLDALIAEARQIQKKGVTEMSFQRLNETKLQEYAEEARHRWGQTEAYQEYEQRTKTQSKDQQTQRDSGLMQLFVEFGALRTLPPQSKEAQAQAKKLQEYLTAHYYTCTKDILNGLGQMYAAGGEMTANIDAAGGKGTGAFVQKVLEIYCAE
ncbi:MAG: MerR family transcriptional regulator [Faecalibacterium sp.]